MPAFAAPVGGWVEATYKISGAYKRTADEVYLSTPEGHVLKVDSAANTGLITMSSGTTHAVTDQTPPERRSLKRGPEPKFKTARMMSEARRKLGYFSALQTSGSFTMMQAGGF